MTTLKLIVVVGKSASGKTTLSKLLAASNYAYVSASNVLSRTFGIDNIHPDKHSLAERGGFARGTPGLAKFHDALFRRINESTGNVVLDGPRFAETVRAIRPSAVYSLLVYLDCPDSVRRQRLNSDGRSSDWTWLAQHPTEESVTEMREMADVILDGTRQAREVLGNLKKKSQFLDIY